MEKQLFKVVYTDGASSIVGISLLDKKVDLVHLKGRMLTLEQWGLLVMIWTPTAEAVREYCRGNRKNKFAIEAAQKEMGRSTDLKLVIFEPVGSGEFHITKHYSAMHISMCDKLNYGWAGYVGDFVEFLAYYYEGTLVPNVFRLEVDAFEWPMRIEGLTSDVDYVDLVALQEPPMYRKQYRLDQEYPGPEQEDSEVVHEDTPDMFQEPVEFDLADFKNGTLGVLCETETQAQDFLKYLHRNGLGWEYEGEATLEESTRWDQCGGVTCYGYNIHGDGVTLYHVVVAKRAGLDVIKYEEIPVEKKFAV